MTNRQVLDWLSSVTGIAGLSDRAAGSRYRLEAGLDDDGWIDKQIRMDGLQYRTVSDAFRWDAQPEGRVFWQDVYRVMRFVKDEEGLAAARPAILEIMLERI